MQERGPPQPVDSGGGQVEFGGDHVGVDTDPLGVAAGVPVVGPQRADESQDLLGRSGDVTPLARTALLGKRLERPQVAGLSGDRESGRRATGEQHREIKEGGKRSQAARGPVDGPQGGQRARENLGPPPDREQESRAGVRARNDSADDGHDDDRSNHGCEDDGHSQRPGGEAPAFPARLVLRRGSRSRSVRVIRQRTPPDVSI